MVNQINNGAANAANQNVRLDSAKQQAADTANKQAQTNPVNTAKTAADSVSLTAQAKQLKNLSEKAEQAPGFDEKKVNELKKAIANGEYKIDAEKLAENISNMEFGFFGR